jgi:hypothetical protein
MQLIIKECARLASNLTHLTIFLLRSDGKIDADELSSVFRILGHTAKKVTSLLQHTRFFCGKP